MSSGTWPRLGGKRVFVLAALVSSAAFCFSADRVLAQSASTTTLTSSANPVSLDNPVTFSATVSGSNGDAPAGTVTLSGTPAANSGSSYPLTITAANGFDTDATQSFTLTVNEPPYIVQSGLDVSFDVGTYVTTTITTTGYPRPTFTTSGNMPSGLTFVDNGDGTATISGTPTMRGLSSHYVYASNGVGEDAVRVYHIFVFGLLPAVTLNAPASSIYGEPFTMTASVTSDATGTVDFMAGTNVLGSGTVSNGVASFSTGSTALAAGTHSITAVYSGDTRYEALSSTAASHVVAKASTKTTLTATPTSARPGQRVKLTATVSANAPSAAPVSGTVTFKDDTKLLGNVAVASGRALLNATDLEIGTANITAGFAGTANFDNSGGAASVKVTPKLGPEFLVNTATVNAQQTPSIARLTGNAFVVVWVSNLQDGANNGIYGQRYKANGTKFGVEFRVNTTTAGSQTGPVVASLSGGGFVVVWQSGGQDRSGTGIVAQRYTASGVKAGAEFVVNTTTAGNQSMPSVAGFSSGGFVVAWVSPDGPEQDLGIFAQRYDAIGNKVGKEFRVNTETWQTQTRPAVATLPNGMFVIVWHSSMTTDSGIYGQRYKPNGVAFGAEFLVGSAVGDPLSPPTPSVAGTADSGFVVAWNSSQPDIRAQRYKPNGGKLGGIFVVNTQTAGGKSQPVVSAFADGGFVVFWTSNEEFHLGLEVFGQIYLPNGAPNGGEFGVNTTTARNQSQPALVATSEGNFVGVWTSRDQDGSSDGVYGQRFNAPMD